MRRCRICGCTDYRSCEGGCFWVDGEDLCSACYERLTASAIEAVVSERISQDAIWGEQNHEPQYWMGILGEEFGELCQAVNETVFNNGPIAREKGGYTNMRTEAVQVAAVAIAFVEMLDRRERRKNCAACLGEPLHNRHSCGLEGEGQ